MVKIRRVKMEDLPGLLTIENLCFSKEEAAAKEAFERRIRIIADSFFVAEEEGAILGLINGPVIEIPFITDDLFTDIKPNPGISGHQSILGLAVAPHYQNRGVATALMTYFEKAARDKQRETITLTCKEDLIPFYEKLGFINKGVSSSEHGGQTWFNMIKVL